MKKLFLILTTALFAAGFASCTDDPEETVNPVVVSEILRALGGYGEAQIERVKYLIAHHHTYSNIQGIDLQILIEADFLVNLYEHSDESVASKVLEKIFKTASGTKLCKTMFRL